MENIHDKTNHSYISIRKNSFFLDWQTQPKSTKTYPHFFNRFDISHYEQLKDLDLIGKVTFEKTYPTGKHTLRTVPSAGALYPCEVYIQIKGIKGLLNGIYHYEPKHNTLCLISELQEDGVEYYFKNQNSKKGFVFLISSVYFRSSWKYRNRSIRYILLDSGHQLGAIYAALCVMDKESKIKFDFDKKTLNDIFGFRDDEMLTCSLLSSEDSINKVSKLKQKLPFVCGSDYLETNTFIENTYNETCNYEYEDINGFYFFKNISKDKLKKAIEQRRSIRAFYKKPILKDQFDFIIENIFTFASTHNIEIFYTVHNVDGLKQGLYKYNEILKDGDFSSKSKYLSLEQNIGGQSAVTFYFTSKNDQNYQAYNILSGFLAHIIYIKSTLCDIGATGIGAYYDNETKEFLETKNNILYMLAIGN